MAGEEGKFTIVDKDGNKIECDVLFTFESDKTHKNYIVYTDNTKDELGNTKVYASVYDPKNPDDIVFKKSINFIGIILVIAGFFAMKFLSGQH